MEQEGGKNQHLGGIYRVLRYPSHYDGKGGGDR